MKNIQVVENYSKLEQAKLKGISGSKLNYAILCNKALLKTTAEAIQASRVYTPEFDKYLEDTKKIFDKYADKDANGDNVIYGNQHKISNVEYLQKYKFEILEFSKDKEDLMAAAAIVDNEFFAFLEEESTIEIKTVSISLIPETITIEQLDALMFMVTND
jgi:hypothetical protein